MNNHLVNLNTKNKKLPKIKNYKSGEIEEKINLEKDQINESNYLEQEQKNQDSENQETYELLNQESEIQVTKINNKNIIEYYANENNDLSIIKKNICSFKDLSDQQKENDSFKQLNVKEIYNLFTQNQVDDILINIKLISKIEIGDKIYDDDKYINIDTNYFKPLTRWINNINRIDNLKFINNVYINAFKLYDILIKNININNIYININKNLLFRLNSELKSSIFGLHNYKKTYVNDKLFQSEIDILIENINQKIL